MSGKDFEKNGPKKVRTVWERCCSIAAGQIGLLILIHVGSIRGQHLIAHCGGIHDPDPGLLCYFIDKWLENEPLPEMVSEDPLVEEEKVRELKRLFAALNR